MITTKITKTTTDLGHDWKDVLLKASSIVEEGWCQGANHKQENGLAADWLEADQSCAGGAISRALNHLSENPKADMDVWNAALIGLEKHLGRPIVPWNDDQGRTAEEVADAMRQAATA